MAARASRHFSPFQREEAAGVIDMGAKLGRVFAAERATDSVNLFEAAADHARRLAGDGKRVIFASFSEGASAGSDIHASKAYREHLARVLVRRALEEAAARASDGTA